jgi:hypothetical protein
MFSFDFGQAEQYISPTKDVQWNVVLITKTPGLVISFEIYWHTGAKH